MRDGVTAGVVHTTNSKIRGRRTLKTIQEATLRTIHTARSTTPQLTLGLTRRRPILGDHRPHRIHGPRLHNTRIIQRPRQCIQHLPQCIQHRRPCTRPHHLRSSIINRRHRILTWECLSARNKLKETLPLSTNLILKCFPILSSSPHPGRPTCQCRHRRDPPFYSRIAHH